MANRVTRVNRLDILNQIRANYERHKRNYAEAVEGYRLEVEARLDAMTAAFEAAVSKKQDELTKALTEARAALTASAGAAEQPAISVGCNNSLSWTPAINLAPPVSHAQDYEVVIRTLEVCVDDVIELDTAEIESYVMDRWSWQKEFESVNAFYHMSAKNLKKR